MNHSINLGAIASGHDLTSNAGIAMLKRGGNAFDAAIAASFMACVCEPVLASPGGGGFANIQTPKENYILDFFVQTPLNKSTSKIDFQEVQADFGETKQTFHIGQASTATPGFLPGLLQLHQQHANLPLEALLKPAIYAGRNGVVTTGFQAYLSTVVEPILTHTKQAQKIFAPNGHLIKQGQLFYNKALASFFNQLAGAPTPKAFDLDQPSGHLTQQDLTTYQPIKRQSKSTTLNGANVYLNSLPAASGELIAHAIHQLKETPNPCAIDIAKALKKVDKARTQAKGNLAKLAVLLSPPAYRGTTHISVIDKNRNACAITLSNGEGNGHIVENAGFMLNNMLGEADVNPNGKMGWPTNMRLSSMMSPTIVQQNDGCLYALGSGGSSRIRSAIFQVLINLIVYKQSPTQAVASPRLHVENSHLDFETMANLDQTHILQDQFPSHRCWNDQNMFFGGCHMVALSPDGHFSGAGDPRRQGSFKTC